MNRATKQPQTDYVKSGAWRCGKSETGAHWWTMLKDGTLGWCRFCKQYKVFPTPVTEFTATPEGKERLRRISRDAE